MTARQATLLWLVKRSPGLSLAELALEEGISPPALSGHVDRLERAGPARASALERGSTPRRSAAHRGRRTPAPEHPRTADDLARGSPACTSSRQTLERSTQRSRRSSARRVSRVTRSGHRAADADVPEPQPPPQLPDLLHGPARIPRRDLDAERRACLARAPAVGLAARRRRARRSGASSRSPSSGSSQAFSPTASTTRRLVMATQAAAMVVSIAARGRHAHRNGDPAARLRAGRARRHHAGVRRARPAVADVPDGRAEALPNAVALNAGLFNGSRVIGPAIAGAVIATAGTGVCFVLNAVSFLAVLTALACLRAGRAAHVTATLRLELVERHARAVRFVRHDPQLRRADRRRDDREHRRVQLPRARAAARLGHPPRRPRGLWLPLGSRSAAARSSERSRPRVSASASWRLSRSAPPVSEFSPSPSPLFRIPCSRPCPLRDRHLLHPLHRQRERPRAARRAGSPARTGSSASTSSPSSGSRRSAGSCSAGSRTSAGRRSRSLVGRCDLARGDRPRRPRACASRRSGSRDRLAPPTRQAPAFGCPRDDRRAVSR